MAAKAHDVRCFGFALTFLIWINKTTPTARGAASGMPPGCSPLFGRCL